MINVVLTMQMLEKFAELKQTASRLMDEPLEMVNFRQQVIDLEKQHVRAGELIKQAKDQVEFSEEVL